MINPLSQFQLPVITGVGGFVLGTLLGIGIGWKLYHPEQVLETYQPAIVLENNAVALERKPGQPPPKALKKAAKELKGHLSRSATVKLQPRPSADSPKDCKCDPIELDIGLVDQGNGVRTVVNTDDADVIGGSDNPIDPYKIARTDKWSVGVIVPIENPKGLGPAIGRRIGPFELGVSAMQPTKAEGWAGYVTASIKF